GGWGEKEIKISTGRGRLSCIETTLGVPAGPFPFNERPFLLNKKPLSFNKKGLPSNKKGLSPSKKGLSFNGRPFPLSKKPFPFNKKGLSLNKKGLPFNGKPLSLSEKASLYAVLCGGIPFERSIGGRAGALPLGVDRGDRAHSPRGGAAFGPPAARGRTVAG